MLNQVVLVGRLTEKPIMQNLENDKKVCYIKLAITRCYKNCNGEYETDFINCTLYQTIANNVVEWCKKGDLVGVKGRLETKDNELQIIAEKVSFLSSKKENEK